MAHALLETGGGFFKKMGTAIKGAAVSVEKGINSFSSEVQKGYTNVTHDTFDSEFRRLFRLGWEERLWDGKNRALMTLYNIEVFSKDLIRIF